MTPAKRLRERRGAGAVGRAIAAKVGRVISHVAPAKAGAVSAERKVASGPRHRGGDD